MHTRHAKGMCVSGQSSQEEEEVRGKVRFAVVLNDSSTQQHSPSQPSIFISLGVPSYWGVRGPQVSHLRPKLNPGKQKPLFSFIYWVLTISLYFLPCLCPNPPIPLSSLFVVRCGGCAEAISPTELVMRAGAAVFHLRCFTCSVCSCRLQTGDRCVLREGRLLCAREDYHQCLASPTSSDTGTSCLFVHMCLTLLLIVNICNNI